MSEETAEIVRRLYRAINEGELDDAIDLLAEGVRWSRPPDVPITGTLEGVDAIRGMWQSVTGALQAFEVEPTRIDENGDRVLARITMRGTGTEEGASFEFSGAHVVTMRDGRVERVQEFRSLPEAEAALGE